MYNFKEAKKDAVSLMKLGLALGCREAFVLIRMIQNYYNIEEPADDTLNRIIFETAKNNKIDMNYILNNKKIITGIDI